MGACAVAGLGGLGNEAKRNAKTDQLRLVPRHNINKETESNEDTEPGHCASTLLGAGRSVDRYLFGESLSVAKSFWSTVTLSQLQTRSDGTVSAPQISARASNVSVRGNENASPCRKLSADIFYPL